MKKGDDAKTFRTFKPTQPFLNLKKKLLLTRYEARVNILVIILLRNCYLLKYCFKKYTEIIFFYL